MQNQAKWKSFSHCWYPLFLSAQTRVASIVSFFQAFWGKIFLKSVRGGRNIEWMRRVYNIEPKKLFLFNLFCLLTLYYFPFTKFIQAVSAWIKIALKSSLNLQKCLEHLNLAKIIKWKLKSRTAKRIVIDLEYAFTCEGFFFTYHVHRILRNM